ncbi:hypothetical protein K438DRAFT_1966859 [Mycena galopus ATCC 62051]|nr:hypothetical protein K438DRAFT_1966859 [Mycena galopus ATCC 62051]
MFEFPFLSENNKFRPQSATTPTVGPPPPPNKYSKSFRWTGQYAALDETPALNARSTAAQIPISHLKISTDQRKLIEEMYHPTASALIPTPPLMDYIYSLDDASQLQASAVMAQYDPLNFNATTKKLIADCEACEEWDAAEKARKAAAQGNTKAGLSGMIRAVRDPEGLCCQAAALKKKIEELLEAAEQENPGPFFDLDRPDSQLPSPGREEPEVQVLRDEEQV